MLLGTTFSGLPATQTTLVFVSPHSCYQTINTGSSRSRMSRLCMIKNDEPDESRDLYYRKKIKNDPKNALLLANYARFLKEVRSINYGNQREFTILHSSILCCTIINKWWLRSSIHSLDKLGLDSQWWRFSCIFEVFLFDVFVAGKRGFRQSRRVLWKSNSSQIRRWECTIPLWRTHLANQQGCSSSRALLSTSNSLSSRQQVNLLAVRVELMLINQVRLVGFLSHATNRVNLGTSISVSSIVSYHIFL